MFSIADRQSQPLGELGSEMVALKVSHANALTKRLAGELTELRGPDLSPEETHELLQAAGIALSDGCVDRLVSGPKAGPPACGWR